MKDKIINTINKIKTNKRAMYLICSIVLFLFCFALNVSFSLFTKSNSNNAANIKVKNMLYSMTINGVSGTVTTVNATSKEKDNVSITGLNDLPSKYELYYHVCSDVNCETYIEKPEGLTVLYSSRTKDPVKGSIEDTGNRNIRIIIKNTTSTTYYIKYDVNAGYSYNTLAYKNLITEMYDEDDLTVYAYVGGTATENFPTAYNYSTTVNCTINGESSSATPNVYWNGSKWLLNVSNMDTGENVCTVNFTLITVFNLKNAIIANAGGVSTITNNGTPSFSSTATSTGSMYAATDNYGTSYYYRGQISNNWVYFAGIYWRIIRINGDNTIRMIYSGTTAPTADTASVMTGTGTQINTSYFNYESTNTNYGYWHIGYKYAASQSFGTTTESTISTAINTWYYDNILSYNSFIADEIFCNDRSIYSGTYSSTASGQSSLTYYGYNRLNTNKTPTLVCPTASDKFTSTGGTAGNQALTYPVGLISADEVSMAGAIYYTLLLLNGNSTFYLYTGQAYWTMTPFNLSRGGVGGNYYYSPALFNLSSEGRLNSSIISTSIGVRPVINLKSNTDVTGSGTYNDPYIVKGLSS